MSRCAEYRIPSAGVPPSRPVPQSMKRAAANREKAREKRERTEKAWQEMRDDDDA